MSLKAISVGAFARALAAAGVLGATLAPAVAAAQILPVESPVQLLAKEMALAAQRSLLAADNKLGVTKEEVQTGIEGAIDGLAEAALKNGMSPEDVQLAILQAQPLFQAALPGLVISANARNFAFGTAETAFKNAGKFTLALADTIPTGSVKKPGPPPPGQIGGQPPGGGPPTGGGFGGGGGGGGGSGSHRH